MASYGPRMLELTAQLADGWVPEAHTPATYGKTLEKIQTLMRRSGRPVESLEPCLALVFYPFEPDSEAYGRILDAARHYLATYPDVLWTAGHGQEHPGLRTQDLMTSPQLWDRLAAQVPEELAESTLVYGNAEECIQRITRFADAGCRHMILEPYWVEERERLEAVQIAGEMIRPALQEL